MRSAIVPLSSRSQPTAEEIALKSHLQRQYVKQLWIFLTVVIGLLTLINWTTRLYCYILRPQRTDVNKLNDEKKVHESPNPGRTGQHALRRLPVAFRGLFKVVAFRTTVPIGPSSVMSISELTFIIGYIVAMLVWLWVNTNELETFYFEDRAAHLASCQLPLIVALAGKNNVLSWMTGVSHEKLNVLHRAAARTCLVFLWIHALIRGISGLPAKFDLDNGWMRWGVAGLTAFSLATVLSLRPIRQKFFEFFLVTHIILIGIFLVGGFLHAKHPGFGDYIWPALLVWGLERLARIARVIYNNRLFSRMRSTYSHASVELLTHDTVRLTLQRKMHWTAGQHAYLILPSVSTLPTEAHPFTIASIPHTLNGADDSLESEMVFIIRGRRGFTKKLRDHASTKGASSSVPAYIDGPYGCPPNLKTFSTCILIAGGSGVSYTLPLLLDLVYHARKNSAACKRIVFVWVIKDPEHLGWINKLLTTAIVSAPSTLTIDPRIHITGPKAQLPYIDTLEYSYAEPPSPSSASSEDKKIETIMYTALKSKRGRPDIHRVIQDSAALSEGPVSVDVAGPSSLASAVRSALTSEITSPSSVMKGQQEITLHVETFGMVKG